MLMVLENYKNTNLVYDVSEGAARKGCRKATRGRVGATRQQGAAGWEENQKPGCN